MTKSENLLVTLSEECAEIQQAVSKSLRFGLDCHSPDTPMLTNERDIMVEYYQLIAVMGMLIDDGILHQLSADDAEAIIQMKKAKVEFYQSKSRELGCIK